jgi:hypothetical protein
MPETKYGHLILSETLKKDISHYKGESILAHEGEFDADCSIGYHCIGGPMSFDRSHSHPFAEMLCFIGGDPTNVYDLGGEVEITLGEEEEKHTITTASVVAIPPDLRHCPIVFTRVDRPMVFLEISMVRKWQPGEELPPPEK